MELTIEQKRAIALASARARAAAAQSNPPTPPAQPSIDDIDGGNLGERYRAGIGMSVDRTLDGLTQLYLKAIGDDKAQGGLETNLKEKQRLDKPLIDSTAGSLGKMTGDIAQVALPGAAATSIPAKVMLPKLAATLAPYAGAAAVGGAYEGIQPTTGDESHLENAGSGALMGAGGQLAGNVLGKTISGLVGRSKDALKLSPQVAEDATLGQLADRGSLVGRSMSRIEEGMKSIPFIGSHVAKQRTIGQNAFRQDILDRVSPDGFRPMGHENARQAVGQISDEFTNRYNSILSNTTIRPSRPFESRVTSVLKDPRIGLQPQQRQEVKNMVMGYYKNIFTGQNGTPALGVPGTKAKEFEAFLTKMASNYEHSAQSNPMARQVAQAFDRIEDAWTVAYRAQMPIAARKALRPLDAKYAPFKTVERAAAAIGNEGGDFTPSQLLNSVKARSTLPRFAREEGMLQDQAQAGKAVFGDKVADSGTTERGLVGAFGLGALADPVTAASVLGGAALGTTKPGRNAMLGDTVLQKLLQQLRADKLSRSSGVPIGQMVGNEE